VPSAFEDDTAVEALGDGRFSAHMSPRWWVARGPNGGYVAAVMLRALEATVAEPARAPRSLTVHYPAAPAEGPVEIDTRVERAGRSLTTLSARMTQDGRTMALALAAFSRPREGQPEFSDARMPEVAPPEELEPLHRPDPAPPFLDNFDFRFAGGVQPFSAGPEAYSAGWMRPRDAYVADPALVTAMTDAWIPVLWSRLDRFVAVPTVDLTVHFRAPVPPDAGPEDLYLGAFRARVAHEGFWEEDGEIWTRDGVLLAQSRQLAIMLS
jgi:acyl-CoA thioesterase